MCRRKYLQLSNYHGRSIGKSKKFSFSMQNYKLLSWRQWRFSYAKKKIKIIKIEIEIEIKSQPIRSNWFAYSCHTIYYCSQSKRVLFVIACCYCCCLCWCFSIYMQMWLTKRLYYAHMRNANTNLLHFPQWHLIWFCN